MMFRVSVSQDEPTLTQISALVNEFLQKNDGIYRGLFAIIEQELFSNFRINHDKVPIDYLENL